MRINYNIVKSNRHISSWSHTVVCGFRFKQDAIRFVRDFEGKSLLYIQSRRTGKRTYILHPQQTKCSVCGNELNGKQRCSFCETLHIY